MARPLLSDRAVASLRRTVGRALAHSYTRVPLAAGAADAWGQATASDGAAVTGIACLYQAQRHEIGPDGRGEILVDTPSLLIAHDDPLAEGDRVASVADSEGVVLLASAEVEAILPEARPGATVFKRANLRGAAAGG